MQLKNAPSPILLNEAGKLIDINFGAVLDNLNLLKFKYETQ